MSARDRRPLGCATADLAVVDGIVRGSGTSFARGMRVLEPDRRYAMFAIYAFCRLVDDVADDEAVPLAERLPRLERWRARVAGLYAGRTADALDRVLLAAIDRYALRQADFDAVIDGMRTDAETVVVAPDPDAFDLYCDRVASAVGRLSVRAFGDRTAEADRVAHHLGRALQITNILRDLGEDAERGRLYLPGDVLDAHGVPRLAGAALRSPALPDACREMADRADRHFDAAREAMRRCDRRAMRPARLMALSYRAILRSLREADWRDPTVRVRVPLHRKLGIALRAAIPF